MSKQGTMTMRVRDYDEQDFEAVAAVYADAKLDELRFEPQPFTLTPLSEDPAILAAFKESDILVCEANGIAGFAASVPGQLRALFVRSDARGRGVGQALLRAVMAKEGGPLSLNVAKSNAPAIGFYEKFGFAIAAETARQYSGINVVYYRMTWSGAKLY
jgi:putative acetyltransferase